MSAVSDAFVALTTSLSNKFTRDNGKFLPIDGSVRMTGTLQVQGDVQASGDVDGNYYQNTSGQWVPYVGP